MSTTTHTYNEVESYPYDRLRVDTYLTDGASTTYYRCTIFPLQVTFTAYRSWKAEESTVKVQMKTWTGKGWEFKDWDLGNLPYFVSLRTMAERFAKDYIKANFPQAEIDGFYDSSKLA